jgi:hypothetical protein
MKLKQSILTLLTFLITTVIAPQAARAVSLTVVADGLDNPRNLAFDNDGNLYVTLSGRGGDGQDGRCIPSPSAQYIPLCAGDTGGLIKITSDGQQIPIISNFSSLALTPSGEQAAGPADIKFDASGNAYLLTGLAGNPNQRDTVLDSPLLGRLFKVDLNTGSLASIADFAAYEAQYNPDGTDIISNPYAFTIKDNLAYVVDGGGNTIYSVGLDGSGIKDVAAFPDKLIPPDQLEYPEIPAGVGGPAPGSLEIPPGYSVGPNGLLVSNQSVPTGIAVAPDGSLTVSEYSYFPYPENEARIFKVNDDLETTVLADGFTQLTGVAYDPEGNLYALQHINTSEWKEIAQGGVIIGDISSSLLKITPDGTRTTIWSGNGLEAASGLTFGPDNNLYTSNRARLAGTGQVVKFDLSAKQVPEPASVLGVLAAAGFGANILVKRDRRNKESANAEMV